MKKKGKREDLMSFSLEFYYSSELDKKLERCFAFRMMRDVFPGDEFYKVVEGVHSPLSQIIMPTCPLDALCGILNHYMKYFSAVNH